VARRLSQLHPLFFALFPALSLAASNAAAVSMRDVWPAAATSLAAAALLWCLLRPMLRSWQKAAVMTSLTIVAFFSYEPLHAASHEWIPLRHRYALPLLALGLLAAFRGLRRARREPAALAQVLTFVSVLLVAFPAIRLVRSRGPLFEGRAAAASARARAGGRERPDAGTANLPDVYYVILDGYASAETLRAVYGFDNREFLDALKARGFYVADRSHSNYSQTPLSLASSTNMEYLSRAIELSGRETKLLQPLYDLIEESRVLRTFRERGYRTITFQSGWTVTARNRNSDWDVNCGGWSEFTRVLARTTVLDSLGFFRKIEVQTRNRVLCELATLPQIPHRIPGPRYVFAHVVSPEPPLLFGRNGEAPPPTKDDAILEWGNRPGYVEQVIFLNRSVLAAVDRILAEARTPPVIVLQGDHGSAATSYRWLYSDAGPPPSGDEPGLDVMLRERMGILNAYHLPGGPAGLYESITPVNSFRVILNRYLGASYRLLEDRSYFSRYAHPYRWIDVTDRLAATAGAPPPASAVP
jgi:hypothetical protein